MCFLFLFLFSFRPCSVANFGPTLSSEGASFSAESVIYDPANLLCAPPKLSATATATPVPSKSPPAASSGEASGTGDSSGGSSTSSSKWWQWSLLQFLSGDVTGTPGNGAGINGFDNKGGGNAGGNGGGGKLLALVDRGDCLFEDKANNAVLLGAQGLVVRNSEVM